MTNDSDDSIRSHAEYPTLTALHLDMLIFMARFGRILKRHASALWFDGRDVTAWRHLRRLHDLGLVQKAPFYRSGRTPIPVGDLYILTNRGEEIVREVFPGQDRERFTTARRGSIVHQAEHQVELLDLVVQLLRELPDIPGIVGINGAIEMRLGPEREPRCDGLIWIRRWMEAAASDEPPVARPFIPWLGERERIGQTSRWYAVEIDRNTEAANIIAAKARAYRDIFESGWWHGKYQWPVPLFVVPTEGRREVVLREWERGWPGSPIMITTKPQLDAHGIDAPIWIAQHHGERIARQFFETWRDWKVGE